MDREMMARQKKRIIGSVTSKTRTSFIYCLAEFEELFGFMWGHGEKEENLEEEQRINRKFYEELRNKILDNGNNQIRKIEKELGDVL